MTTDDQDDSDNVKRIPRRSSTLRHLLIPESYVRDHHAPRNPGLHLTLSDWKTNNNPEMQAALLQVKNVFERPRLIHFANVHVKGTIEFHDQEDEFYRVIRRVTDLYGDLKPKPGVWPHLSLD